MTAITPLTIYTIGHSNVPAFKIIELLKQQDIQVVVDVRSSPYSKHVTQFNREMFQSVLNQAGIDYKFAGEYLGGRPKDPSCYKNGQIPVGHADFLQLVDYPAVMTKEWYQKGINRLLEIATQARTAIICSEEDPARCHRQHLISQTLLKMGVGVLHIRGNGQTQKAWLLEEIKPAKKEEKPLEQPSLLVALLPEENTTDEVPMETELVYEPIDENGRLILFPDFLNGDTPQNTSEKKPKKSKKVSDAVRQQREQEERERLQKWLEGNKKQ